MSRRKSPSASLLTLLLFAAACGPPAESPAPPATEPETAAAPEAAAPATRPARTVPRPSSRELAAERIRGRVVETMDAGGYTYVRVDAGGDLAWAAAPQFDVGVGDEVVVPTTMPMPDYESRTLERTFDLVYFCSTIEVEGRATKEQAMAAAHGRVRELPEPDLEGIERAPGGLTVAEILADAARLSGREVAIRGRVVKFSSRIMGRNWVHLQDGTGEGGPADLTVTTNDEVQVGDLVLVRGRVATEQDFGYGYAYDVLVQDAALSVE